MNESVWDNLSELSICFVCFSLFITCLFLQGFNEADGNMFTYKWIEIIEV